MSGSWNESLFRQLGDKEFRDAYVAEDIRTGIANQIRVLREARGLSQAELGARAGKAQSAIARLEDPDYGRFSLTTLLELASAFDLALLVRFTSFSELIERNRDLSPAALLAPSFQDDFAPVDGGTTGSQIDVLYEIQSIEPSQFSNTMGKSDPVESNQTTDGSASSKAVDLFDNAA